MVRASLAWVLAVATAAASAQSIVRCVDAAGNVTYQDAPCTKGEAGRNVELPKAETREDTTAWEEAARSARVVRGMPKRWVLRSKGAPYEIRPPDAREDATEVWRYAARTARRSSWDSRARTWRGCATTRARARFEALGAAPLRTGLGAEAFGARRAEPQVRAAGRYCEHVFAEIGAADREETWRRLPGRRGAASAESVKRYFYDPAAGDPSMRTVFSCVDGKVVDVERTVVQVGRLRRAAPRTTARATALRCRLLARRPAPAGP
jgi:hypothetical protein